MSTVKPHSKANCPTVNRTLGSKGWIRIFLNLARIPNTVEKPPILHSGLRRSGTERKTIP